MRRLIPTILLLAACGGGSGPAVAVVPVGGGTTTLTDGFRKLNPHRVVAVDNRRIGHAAYWLALAPFLKSPALTVRPIGASLLGRELRAITFGHGPTRVLLWSQMHGDESTATMALADLLAWLADPAPDPLRDRLSRALTITIVPMLNPDGAERFQRENAAGIDINRDARRLSTPEARALKALHDSLKPAFGFNLHDQGARTRAGTRGPQAAIALLAPAIDASGRYDAVRNTARRIAATIARALSDSIPGRVAKYDEGFNPRAFGDLMQTWGTSTVLIESGALPDDPDKQRLRGMNGAALLVALDEIATTHGAAGVSAAYDALPPNSGGAVDLLVRGGMLVLPGQAPFRADLSLTFDDLLLRTNPRLREVGDLSAVIAIDTVDVTGMFLHPTAETLRTGPDGVWLPLGGVSRFVIRRSADPASAPVRTVPRE
ncbi:MAG: M14 family zinc carboxypeptidase [Gemmatimonadales bacterium]